MSYPLNFPGSLDLVRTLDGIVTTGKRVQWAFRLCNYPCMVNFTPTALAKIADAFNKDGQYSTIDIKVKLSDESEQPLFCLNSNFFGRATSTGRKLGAQEFTLVAKPFETDLEQNIKFDWQDQRSFSENAQFATTEGVYVKHFTANYLLGEAFAIDESHPFTLKFVKPNKSLECLIFTMDSVANQWNLTLEQIGPFDPALNLAPPLPVAAVAPAVPAAVPVPPPVSREPAPPPPAPAQTAQKVAAVVQEKVSEDAELCGICMERLKNAVIIPCGHLGYCMECLAKVSDCPICRRPIGQRVQVFKT